ncbi:MAG: leader peptidase (prepilin peptidase)/N-methyltransferase [Kiritimatiellia bacterium]|jgi:leader peptidase (prepilin peptidase)/N-methyltransferase
MTDAWLMAVFASFATVFGLVFGSFLNVLIARWPHDASLLTPSHCPKCGAGVRPWDLVPVLSWLWLGGKCRDCKAPISRTYPMVELLMAGVGWLMYQRFFSVPDDLVFANVVAWIVFFTFACLIVVMAFVDLRYQIIPDQTSIYAVPIGIAGAIALELVGFEGFLGVGWMQSVLGALLGGGFLGLVALIGGLVLKEEALGWGDAKVLAMIGAFVGAVPGVWMVLLAGSVLQSIVGLLYWLATRKRMLPLGPALGVVSIVYVLYGDAIVPLYLPYFWAAWVGS